MSNNYESSISLTKRQELICEALLSDNDKKTIVDLINNWCPVDKSYKIYKDQEITFKEFAKYNPKENLKKTFAASHFNFITEIIIIFEKLEKEKILYRRGVIKPSITIEIINPSNKEKMQEDNFKTKTKSELFYDIMANEYYVDKEELKKFINNKHKTNEERKEKSTKNSIQIAFCAIFVSLFVALPNFISFILLLISKK